MYNRFDFSLRWNFKLLRYSLCELHKMHWNESDSISIINMFIQYCISLSVKGYDFEEMFVISCYPASIDFIIPSRDFSLALTTAVLTLVYYSVHTFHILLCLFRNCLPRLWWWPMNPLSQCYQGWMNVFSIWKTM